MTDHISFSPKLDREIRLAEATELGVATEELVRQALAAGDLEAAASWAAYLSEEPRRVLAACGPWLGAMVEYGEAHIEAFADEMARITALIGVPPPAPPAVDPHTVGAAEEQRLVAAASAGDIEGFEAALVEIHRVQWKVHDDQGDWLWALYSLYHERLGEHQMEQVYRETLESWVPKRYATLAQLTQREKFELTIDLMRGHFCGPSDDPHINVEDTPDSWVLTFDPCGSGGRMRRGDPMREQASRTEEPYNFSVSEEAHPWTWGKKDVCLYCAHCSFVNEILPIERTGVPLRVTEYPQSPGDQCRWIIYKDAAAVPEEVYTRVGKTKPSLEQQESS